MGHCCATLGAYLWATWGGYWRSSARTQWSFSYLCCYHWSVICWLADGRSRLSARVFRLRVFGKGRPKKLWTWRRGANREPFNWSQFLGLVSCGGQNCVESMRFIGCRRKKYGGQGLRNFVEHQNRVFVLFRLGTQKKKKKKITEKLSTESAWRFTEWSNKKINTKYWRQCNQTIFLIPKQSWAHDNAKFKGLSVQMEWPLH